MNVVPSVRSGYISRSALFIVALTLAVLPVSTPRADDDTFQVVPFVFDPFDTDLVQSAWLGGIGCPTGARVAEATAANNFNPTGPTGTFTDPACPTGDPKDKENEGLLLVKTGPTDNFAAAGAKLEGLPKRFVLKELGYDIRKPDNTLDPRGSHCGAGAPRFNVTTSDGTIHFVGCNSPPPIQNAGPTQHWLRLRWGAAELAAAFPPITAAMTVKSIEIIFDEGQDVAGGPDEFGLAVLDNIDVNGVLVGRGPPREGQGQGDNHDGDHGKK